MGRVTSAALLTRTSTDRLRLSVLALRSWDRRQVSVAAAAAVLVAGVVGTATVLIPNPVFTREIPPVWWNYPVWLLTSALSGALIATYVSVAGRPDRAPADDSGVGGRWGAAGGVMAWFAVGCPVCNKIALLALGYSGAISWFAPLQPVLALAALVLTGVALVARLSGQVQCPVQVRAAGVGAQGR